MRVCYVNPAGGALFDPAYAVRQPHGGAEVAMEREARALARDPGFEVHMIVHGDRARSFRRDGITVHGIAGTYHDQPLPAFADYRRSYLRALDAVEADVYLQRGVPGDLHFLAALVCRARRKSYVLVMASAPTARAVPFSIKGHVRWVLMEQAAIRMATAIVALAHDQIGALPPSVRPRARVIYEGKPAATMVRDRAFVLWAGRPAAGKRPEVFLDLARAFPHERFVMAVSGVLDVPLPPNATIRSNVPHQEMDELYARAKLVVHTSTAEGFSNVFVEAWHNGTPVVSYGVDTDGLIARRGLGRHARTWADLVEGVRRLLDDPEAWQVCSRNARKHAREHHDLDRQIERYKDLFRELRAGTARTISATAPTIGARRPILVISTTRGVGSGAERILAELLRAWPDPAGALAVMAPTGSMILDLAGRVGACSVALDGPDTLSGNWRAVGRAMGRLPRCRLVHGWTAQTFDLAAHVAGQIGVPHAATLHDHPEGAYLNSARRALMRVGAARAAGIVCVSEAVRSACRRAGYDCPLVVIQNGLSTRDARPRAPEARSPEEHVRVGFLGLEFEHKGFAIVSEWIRRSRNPLLRWHLYGTAPRTIRRELAALQAEAAVPVVICGRQPPERIFGEVDVVVHPSLTFDPFPTVLLEAARAGLPAVSSDVGGAAEIVEHEVTGLLFDPERPADGLRQLERLLSDGPLRRRLGDAAEARFRRSFTAPRMIEDYRTFWSGEAHRPTDLPLSSLARPDG